MAELLILLLACTSGSDTGEGTSDGGTSLDGGSSDGGSGDGGSAYELEDERLFRQAVAGEVDAEDALSTIVGRGGLPVETETGSFLFGCLCGPGSWALAGDHEGWSGQAMEKSGELWWIEVEITEPVDSLYKLVEGGSQWQADPLARRYGYDEFGEHSMVRASAARLERWFQPESRGLEGRELRVWVPQDGAFTHALYVHDGQNLFDPEAFWGGWRLQDSLPASMLVVGIDNTAARMDEYTHTTDRIHGTTYGGRGDDYADLVTLDIRPWMESVYGTAERTGVMGSSLGGLISAHIALRHAGDWDMVLSLSGTMGWGSIGADNETLPELWAARGPGPAIYVDSGGSGDCEDSDGDGVPDDDPTSSDNYCENAWMAELLAGSGHTWETDLWHWHEYGAEHNESAWAERVWRPLQLFASY